MAVVSLALAHPACGGPQGREHPRPVEATPEPGSGVSAAPAEPEEAEEEPARHPHHHAATAPRTHALEGMATWYGPGFAGRRTANGERFDPSRLTAAHRTLPFGTRVRVVAISTGASVVVRINDRGPFGRQDRIIDLARGAARRIGLDRAGVMRVRLEVLGNGE